MSKQDEIFNIALLIDNLKHDDVQERLKSASALQKVAAALGQRRTREELLPFLCDCCDDDDEVLLQLTDQLATMIPLVGGDAFAHLILDVLKLLAQSDSKIVRDQAVVVIS